MLVWGLIAFKLIYFSKAPITGSYSTSDSFDTKDSLIKDTIFIYADYRDPFKQSSFLKTSGAKLKESIRPVMEKSKPVAIWPNITFQGSIRIKRDKLIALITVQDKKYVVEKNMEISGVKIMRVFTDSVEVSVQKEFRIITKK